MAQHGEVELSALGKLSHSSCEDVAELCLYEAYALLAIFNILFTHSVADVAVSCEVCSLLMFAGPCNEE